MQVNRQSLGKVVHTFSLLLVQVVPVTNVPGGYWRLKLAVASHGLLWNERRTRPWTVKWVAVFSGQAKTCQMELSKSCVFIELDSDQNAQRLFWCPD
jgi:hypothetical protein